MPLSSDDKHIIVNYHYIEEPTPELAGIHPCSPAEFERQVFFLRSHFRLASVLEVVAAARENSSERLAAITLDDGLNDHYVEARPILKKLQAPATMFLITKTFEGYMPPAHKIHLILSQAKAVDLIDLFNDFLSRHYPSDISRFFIPKDRRLTQRRRYDDTLNANFKETLTIVPEDLRDDFLDFAFQHFSLDEASWARRLFLSRQRAQELVADGFWLESHTHNHVSLEHQSDDFVRQDLAAAGKIISDLTGRRSEICSYPYGRIAPRLYPLLETAGLTVGVTVMPGPVLATTHRYDVPRYDTNDLKAFLNAQV